MSQTKINAFKVLRTEKAALNAEYVELVKNRLPALQARANAAKQAVNQAQQILSQTYDDATFATAKESLDTKKSELRDVELMASNVESRCKSIRGPVLGEVTRKLEIAERDMWEEQYNEVAATLPPLSEESKLIIEKLDSILRHIDPHTHRLGISYGKPITDAQGQPTQQKVDEAKTLLWEEMGI